MSSTKKSSTVGQLEFIVKIKTGGNLTDLARPAIESMQTPGVTQKVEGAIEDADHAIEATNAAYDQLQPIETIVLPLVENLKVVAGLVTEFSKVSVCACRSHRQLIVLYARRSIHMPKLLGSLFLWRMRFVIVLYRATEIHCPLAGVLPTERERRQRNSAVQRHECTVRADQDLPKAGGFFKLGDLRRQRGCITARGQTDRGLLVFYPGLLSPFIQCVSADPCARW